MMHLFGRYITVCCRYLWTDRL